MRSDSEMYLTEISLGKCGQRSVDLGYDLIVLSPYVTTLKEKGIL